MRFGPDFSRDGMGVAAFGGGSSQPSGTTTTTQTNSPWIGAQGEISQELGQAANLYNSNPQGPSYYPGSTVAQLNSQQLAPLAQQYNTAMQGGNTGLQSANKFEGQLLGGQLLGQGNPYQQQMNSDITAAVMPGITSQFSGGDRLDSGLATQAAASGLGNAISQSEYGNYANTLNDATKATATAPMVDQSQMNDLTTATNYGNIQQQQNQANINADVQRYNYQQAQPYNALSIYQNLIGNGGSLGSVAQSTTPYYTNQTANTLSGLTGVAGLLGAGANAVGNGSNGISGLLNGWFS